MVRSLARGMDILSILERKGSATVTEIAEEINVDKSTVSRLIMTLKEYDMVRLDPTNKKYRLGLRILYLGDGIRRTIDVASIARPYLHKLCESIGESVHLAAVSNSMLYIIDQIRSKREYTLAANIGMVEPWHCSSVGKCVLAYKPPSYVKQVLDEQELAKHTPRTITDRENLTIELELIRQRGYAIDDEEVVLGVRCVAVPIFNYNGQVNHSIGVSGPKAHMTQTRLEEYIKKMMKYGSQISEELGYGRFNK